VCVCVCECVCVCVELGLHTLDAYFAGEVRYATQQKIFVQTDPCEW
jgi:hypothetical protein